MMVPKLGNWLKENYQRIIIWALAIVPILVSLISTIHVVNFFQLSNYNWLAITLAIAFEIGALSSLAALAIMDKISKVSLWLIFILITLMQMMGNTYYAFDFITAKMQTDPQWTMNWIELFSIKSADVATTKRLLAIVSGAILPVISLTFLHILIGYLTKLKERDEEYEYIEEYEHDVYPTEESEEIIESEDEEVFEINEDDTIESTKISNMGVGKIVKLAKAFVGDKKIGESDIKKIANNLKVSAAKNPKGVIDLGKYIKFNQKPIDEQSKIFKVDTTKLPPIEEAIERLNTNITINDNFELQQIEESRPMLSPADPPGNLQYIERDDVTTTHEPEISLATEQTPEIKDVIKSEPQKKKILVYREKKN